MENKRMIYSEYPNADFDGDEMTLTDYSSHSGQKLLAAFFKTKIGDTRAVNKAIEKYNQTTKTKRLRRKSCSF